MLVNLSLKIEEIQKNEPAHDKIKNLILTEKAFNLNQDNSSINQNLFQLYTTY
jgi:hypothetical protein